jgi:hypothetical protein
MAGAEGLEPSTYGFGVPAVSGSVLSNHSENGFVKPFGDNHFFILIESFRYFFVL